MKRKIFFLILIIISLGLLTSCASTGGADKFSINYDSTPKVEAATYQTAPASPTVKPALKGKIIISGLYDDEDIFDTKPAEMSVLQETKTQIEKINEKVEQFTEEPRGEEPPKLFIKQTKKTAELEEVELSGNISARLRYLEDIADIGDSKTLSVIFSEGKAEIKEADKLLLNDIAGKYILLIAGYASTSPGKNKEHSLKRASSVADYLYSRGANLEDAKIVGRGPTNIYGDLADNQRVVILYIE